MTQIKCVLFDCDGVVVDSERLSNQVIRDDLAQHGLVMTLEQTMQTFVGGTLEGVGVRARQMGADLPEGWLDQLYTKIYAKLSAEVTVVPGITDVLDALDRAGVPYAMGSNGSLEKMRITLGRTGLLDRFAGRLYSGQDMDRPKPAPDVYLHAARALRWSPAQCAVIEDSASGAKAARSAGMVCFGFVRDTPRDRLAPFADVLFDDMEHLPQLLGV